MRDYCVKNTRILHFEKYLSHEEENMRAAKKLNWKRTYSENREYRSFFSLGYYDQLSYVRCKGDATFDYRHCFLLKYPYRESQRQMITDQVLTLNDTEESIGKNDPFEYEGTRKMPFLGIVLVTVSGEAANQKCTEKIYEKLISVLQEECERFFEQFDSKSFHYKFFYTPNCADLCVALRTERLEYIYCLKQHLSGLRLPVTEECGGVFHAISYTVAEPSKVVWDSEIVKQNKKIGIEMRLSGPGKKMIEIKECLQNPEKSREELQGDKSSDIYGITGAGQYAMEVDFETFADIYPFLGMIKLDSPEPVNCDDLTEIQKCFNERNLECSYMRAKYKPAILDEKISAPEWEQLNGWIVSKYKEEIRNLREHIFASSVSLEGMLREKEMMLKELFYTYNDFWYRPCSWWKGVWFYAQMECMMDGICTQTELIKKYVNKANDKMRERDAAESEYYAERLAVKLGGDITLAVSAVNNFNRLLQSINQYVLNVPNYEIQTKVNVEKYLMAYTAYLLAISSTYRRQIESEKRVVPFIALDLTIGGIKAASLFSMRESIADEGELIESPEICFVIRFPNYQWLANVYHALPMITHEISHNFRYMERSKRNVFAGEYVLYRLSGRLLDQIMETADGDRTLYYGELEHYLFRHINESLKESFEDSPYIRKDVRFQDIGEYVGIFFAERIGASDEKCRQHKRWNLIAREVRELVRLTDIVYIRAKDLMPKESADPDAFIPESLMDCFSIYANVIADILNTEKGKRQVCCEEWRNAIESIQRLSETDEDMREVLGDISNFLVAFQESEQIAPTDIWGIVRMTLKNWKKFNQIVADVYKDDENFRKIFDGICEADSLPEMKICLPKKEISNIEVSDRMACYEKLNRIRQCAGNIMTNIKGDSITQLRDEDLLMTQFAKNLYDRLHRDYIRRLEKRHSEENLWLTFKAEQTWMTSVGIVSSDEKQFVEFFERAAAGITEEEIKTIVADQSSLYEEIFADMGMCKAFGFTAYGYFMYMIHIFMKERDVPRSPGNDLTRDRVTILLTSIYKDEIGMNEKWECNLWDSQFTEALNAYWKDLREHLYRSKAAKGKAMKCLLKCDEFYSVDSGIICEVFSEEEDEEHGLDCQEKKQLEILRWMRRIYDEMNLENWRVDDCKKELILHIRESEKGMQRKADSSLKKTWIELCQEDESVRDIGSYYNHYSYSQILQGHKEGRLLKYQDKFIAKNYASMFDCIHQIRSRMRPGQEKKILDLLFEYDFTVEGGQA